MTTDGWPVNDEADGRAGAPAGATPGVAGWYADPWSNTRRRWWTGSAWTFSTTDTDAPTRPAAPPPRPAVAGPPPAPAPGANRGAEGAALAGKGGPVKVRRVAVAVVLGLVVGLVAAKALHHPARPTTDASGSAAQPSPFGSNPSPSPTTPGPSAPAPSNTDPSAPALASLVVRPADVTSPLTVRVLPGGGGLSQATLDLCNGTFASESRRSARLQDAVVDDQGHQILSTEAVLYDDPSATAQAFTELKTISAGCPSTAVPSPVNEPTVATRFNPPPDANWPQAATVNRMAFDFTTTDASGQTTHSVAVYLQRGRALMGVYFSQPDGAQPAVADQTTVPGIVGVFAGRMAALPTSVVGS